MQWFDTEGRCTRLLNADKEANAFANYHTKQKYFILWTPVVRAMYI